MNFGLSKENEVGGVGDYKVVEHSFGRGIANTSTTSTIPIEDLDHLIMLGKGDHWSF